MSGRHLYPRWCDTCHRWQPKEYQEYCPGCNNPLGKSQGDCEITPGMIDDLKNLFVNIDPKLKENLSPTMKEEINFHIKAIDNLKEVLR